MSALDFRAVIMCDDVRKEVSNKEILIGVYSGDIILPALPAWMPLAIWIELEPRELGKHQLEFRLSLTNKPPVTFKVGMDVHQLSTTSITIPGLQVLAESEGDLKFEFKENNGWRLLKHKRIVKGEVRSAAPIPTFASSHPTNL